jgi:hypothetical protein
MKKLACILLLLPFISNAQESDRKVRFGMKIAPAFCWMKPDFKGGSVNFDAANDGSKLGFNWGPTLEFVLNETFLISTGVDVNSIGGKLSGSAQRETGSIYSWKHEFTNRFLEFPLMIKGRTKEIGHMRYFMHFGLSAGFRYKEKFTLTETLSAGDNIPKLDDKESFTNVFRGTMLVGGGAEYNLSGNTSLVGSITFNNGLTNFINSKGIKKYIETSNHPNDDFNTVEQNSILNFIALNIGVLF